MIHTDTRSSTAIEAVVAEVEAATDAELVVVLAPSSGEYRDRAWACGALAGVLALAFLSWSPIVFDGAWFPVDVTVIGALVGWLAGRRPALLAKLAPAARRARQVREAALAAFAEENVHATPERTGILIYASAAEKRVEIVADHGVLRRVPGAELAAVPLDASSLDSLVSGIRGLGALLSRHLPASGENTDHIPNAPRVRP